MLLSDCGDLSSRPRPRTRVTYFAVPSEWALYREDVEDGVFSVDSAIALARIICSPVARRKYVFG
jgi:hypothetical protein